jgi:hypothetical protein
MESCLIDYSDYENAPGCLATFGGLLCDFGSDFQATIVCDYDQRKIREKIPRKKSFKFPAKNRRIFWALNDRNG